MKKIIIIFIIVFCLLSFIRISCIAKEPYNYGEFWDSMSEGEKCAYISGLHAGMVKSIELVLEKEEVGEFIDIDTIYEIWLLLSPDFEVRVRGISDLYKDPANSYIPIAGINILAYRKIRGESIESSLREEREKAFFENEE